MGMGREKRRGTILQERAFTQIMCQKNLLKELIIQLQVITAKYLREFRLQCSHLNNFYTVIFRILPVVYITNTAKAERNVICVSARQNKIFAPASSLLQWLNELGFRHRH